MYTIIRANLREKNFTRRNTYERVTVDIFEGFITNLEASLADILDIYLSEYFSKLRKEYFIEKEYSRAYRSKRNEYQFQLENLAVGATLEIENMIIVRTR